MSYVDDLENRGYVERRRNPDDRRLHALFLSAAGKKMLRRIGELAHRHDERMTAGLDAAQRENLRTLLQTLAEQHELTPHVHPGFPQPRPRGWRSGQASRVISTTTSRSVEPSPE